MPYCIVAKEHTVDPVGANNPEDFVQILPGEIVKLTLISNLIVTGYVVQMADSDLGEIVTCKCGRMFGDVDHPHFSQAQLSAELFTAQQLLAEWEEGTPDYDKQAEQVAGLERRIAAEKKQHCPIKAKAGDDETAKERAKQKAKAKAKRDAKAAAKRDKEAAAQE